MTVDAQILTALRSAGGVCFPARTSPTSLALRGRRFGRGSRNCVHLVTTSRRARTRVRLRVPDVLHRDDLLSLVRGTRVIGRDIHVFQETSSTNDVVERLARDGVAQGAVVFAEAQTKGVAPRPQMGFTTRQGPWFSVLLRPELRPQDATTDDHAATALARSFAHDLAPSIKWPNDILIGTESSRECSPNSPPRSIAFVMSSSVSV